MATVKQLLQNKGGQVFSVDAEDPVLEAIQLMADHGIGALVVLRGAELAGIVSERDYARKVILMQRSSAETPVWQIMSSPVVTVGPNATVNECMRIMTDKHFRHLVVTDDKKVVGVISIGDLVKAVIEDQQQTIEQLERYISS